MNRLCFAMLLAVLGGCGDDRDGTVTQPSSDAGAPVTSICGGPEETLVVNSANHLPPPIDYPDAPPAGGDHAGCWAEWGVHEEPVPAENWVHNLEHGGVVFLVNCPGDCGEDQAALEELEGALGDKDRALFTPYANMSAKFAVVSWGHRLTMDCVDVTAAAAFYALRVGHGLEDIPSPPPDDC